MQYYLISAPKGYIKIKSREALTAEDVIQYLTHPSTKSEISPEEGFEILRRVKNDPGLFQTVTEADWEQIHKPAKTLTASIRKTANRFCTMTHHFQ